MHFCYFAFLITGLIGVYYCNENLKGKILGEPASDHGVLIDRMLYITIGHYVYCICYYTGCLFWFAYKYQHSDKRKAYYYPHNNKLEVDLDRYSCYHIDCIGWVWIFYWFKITGDAPRMRCKWK